MMMKLGRSAAGAHMQPANKAALSTPARAMMLGGMWDSDVQADWC